MNFEIHRFWSLNDSDNNPNPEVLFKRPRIDYRISEFIFSFLFEYYLNPKKLMISGNYRFTLYFDELKPESKFTHDSIFNTNETTFFPYCSIISENGIKITEIGIFCNSKFISEKIKPIDYSKLVYNMFASYLIEKYKKINFEELINLRDKINYSEIEKFEFPAKFENQKYSGDEGKFAGKYINGILDKSIKPFSIKTEYLNKYKY